MSHRPPSWVDPVMRVGYSARGVVYIVVGVFALLAALEGGTTPDSKSALARLLDKPFGDAMLGAIALGLFCYAVWRFIDALWDLDSKGDQLKGRAARVGQFISGATHLALGISAATMALGRGNGGSNNSDDWTATLMSQPLGRWLVALVGAVVVAIGVQHFIKAAREKYKEELRYTRTASLLDPLVKLGLVAHGLVVLIAGVFFLWAAWTADPSRSGGLREALQVVREADGGQMLFAILALGLLCFSVYCFIEAAFRVVPRCAPKDLTTLASRAMEVPREAARVMHRAVDSTAHAVRRPGLH
jgi:uncharacterized membrane protein